MKSIVVHYQEIALKGRNRPWFLAHLLRSIDQALAGLDVADVRPLMGRVEIVLGPTGPWEEARERLRRVFGIANFAMATRVPADLEAIGAAIVEDLRGREPRSFRISARRADKRFPISSPEIERTLGGRVQAATGWPVRLEEPELRIQIEVLQEEAFYLFEREAGPGGLPTGVSGRVMCLLSGGIDSPVAAWRMMRRGCRAELVHFHAYPIVSNTSQQKVREIAELLARWQHRVRLHLVPFGELQRQVIVTVPPPMRVVVYRRLMLRIAELLARRTGSRALVTGEVVGQVASQTIENLAAIGSAARLPIFRPLIGWDKEEITAEAQRIGSYPISIVPDEDCCTLFTPRHPETRARAAQVEHVERELPVEDLVRTAADAAVMEEFRFPVVQSPVRPPTEAR